MTPALLPPFETAAWELLAAAGCPLSVADIVLSVGPDSLRPIIDALDRWTSDGLLHVTDNGRCYRIADADHPARSVPLTPKVERTGRERMWTAMRVLGTFTVKQITHVAEVPEGTAKHWLGLLSRAGYIARTSKRGEELRYRVMRHTGPRPPKSTHDPVRRNHVVALIDRNTGERHLLAPSAGNLPFF